MVNFPKPNVVISKCLGFAKCRYNGDIVLDAIVDQLKPYVNYITVCPEVEIGLGVPRDPIRVVSDKNKLHLYQPATQKDVTKEMVSFVDKFLSSLSDIDGFILKYRSPSCGINSVRIYNGFSPDARSITGSGFFGGEVVKRLGGLAIEDEGRLKNFSIREYFFTKLFTLAQFRKMKQKRQMKALVHFHTVNKLLFMAHNQNKMRALGKIAANQDKLNINIVVDKYETVLYELFAKPPTFKSWVNVLMHAFGGMSEELSKDERKFFLNMIEQYRDERIPLSVLTKLIYSWAVRFENQYLLEQTFLTPYPEELIEITDSGKGRNR